MATLGKAVTLDNLLRCYFKEMVNLLYGMSCRQKKWFY